MCHPTLEKYYLSARDDRRLFERLLSRAAGDEIWINASNVMALLAFANELENEELLAVQLPKAFSLKSALMQLGEKPPLSCQNEIEDIAAHFICQVKSGSK
jgi:hypothetical protein